MADSKTTHITKGLGFGAALAMAVSFTTNKSLLCAILHGIFGWFDVIYFALGFGR